MLACNEVVFSVLTRSVSRPFRSGNTHFIEYGGSHRFETFIYGLGIHKAGNPFDYA